MTDAPAPEVIPVEPTQPGPAPLEGQMNLPEDPPPAEAKAEQETPAEEKSKRSLDDTIKEAFRKSREEGERKAAEKAEKPEVKPDEEAQPKAEKPRAPDGKFSAQQQEQQPEAPKQTAFKDAPQRFDDAAKREWETVPESVRGNIHRMQRELESGIDKYRRSAEEYETIREYADLARQHGTTVKAALDNYVGMERLLRENPLAGLEQLVSNLGLKDGQGNPLTFRALAMHVAGQAPDKVSAQQDATIAQLRQQVQMLTQQIGGVQQHFQQQAVQQKHQAAASEWDAFARENPRANELQDQIADILQRYPAGDNITIRERLADAYAIAVARNPAPSAAHTGTDALAQNQIAAPRQPKPEGRKSITGSPSTDTLTPSGKKKSPPSIDEALANAVRRAS